MTLTLSVDRVVVGAAHAPSNSAATTRSAQLSFRAEPRCVPAVIPSGGPKGRRRGIAIIPIESPRRHRTADADYADYTVALRASADEQQKRFVVSASSACASARQRNLRLLLDVSRCRAPLSG